MKVLKKPEANNWKYVHTCRECDAELEVEVSDLSHTYYDGDIREPGYDTFSAVCAVCTQAFSIPLDKISKYVQFIVKSKGKSVKNDYYR